MVSPRCPDVGISMDALDSLLPRPSRSGSSPRTSGPYSRRHRAHGVVSGSRMRIRYPWASRSNGPSEVRKCQQAPTLCARRRWTSRVQLVTASRFVGSKVFQTVLCQGAWVWVCRRFSCRSLLLGTAKYRICSTLRIDSRHKLFPRSASSTCLDFVDIRRA